MYLTDHKVYVSVLFYVHGHTLTHIRIYQYEIIKDLWSTILQWEASSPKYTTIQQYESYLHEQY